MADVFNKIKQMYGNYNDWVDKNLEEALVSSANSGAKLERGGEATATPEEIEEMRAMTDMAMSSANMVGSISNVGKAISAAQKLPKTQFGRVISPDTAGKIIQEAEGLAPAGKITKDIPAGDVLDYAKMKAAKPQVQESVLDYSKMKKPIEEAETVLDYSKMKPVRNPPTNADNPEHLQRLKKLISNTLGGRPDPRKYAELPDLKK